MPFDCADAKAASMASTLMSAATFASNLPLPLQVKQERPGPHSPEPAHFGQSPSLIPTQAVRLRPLPLQAKQLPTTRPLCPTNLPRPWHLLQKTSPALTSATSAEASSSIPNKAERSTPSNVALIGFILAAHLGPCDRQRPRLLRLPCGRDSRPTLQTDDHACVSHRRRTLSARITSPTKRNLRPVTIPVALARKPRHAGAPSLIAFVAFGPGNTRSRNPRRRWSLRRLGTFRERPQAQ